MLRIFLKVFGGLLAITLVIISLSLFTHQIGRVMIRLTKAHIYNVLENIRHSDAPVALTDSYAVDIFFMNRQGDIRSQKAASVDEKNLAWGSTDFKTYLQNYEQGWLLKPWVNRFGFFKQTTRLFYFEKQAAGDQYMIGVMPIPDVMFVIQKAVLVVGAGLLWFVFYVLYQPNKSRNFDQHNDVGESKPDITLASKAEVKAEPAPAYAGSVQPINFEANDPTKKPEAPSADPDQNFVIDEDIYVQQLRQKNISKSDTPQDWIVKEE